MLRVFPVRQRAGATQSESLIRRTSNYPEYEGNTGASTRPYIRRNGM